jgi:hypothetical protein
MILHGSQKLVVTSRPLPVGVGLNNSGSVLEGAAGCFRQQKGERFTRPLYATIVWWR